MLKKTLTYEDFDGNERTEDFYFNLSKAELLEMELEIEGGMVQYIQRIVAAKEQKELFDLFKKILLKAYGEKTPDGKHFLKSEELSIKFSQTEAFTEIFFELATNAELAAAFVNGIIPKMQHKPHLVT